MRYRMLRPRSPIKGRHAMLTGLLPLTIGIAMLGMWAYAIHIPPTTVTKPAEQQPIVKSIATGTFKKQLQVNGLDRTYDLYIPKGITSDRSYPLVVLFHGAGANAAAMQQLAGFDTIADEHQVIVAYGNATTDEQRGEIETPIDQQYRGQLWHSGRTFSENIHTIDDVAYAKAVVRHASSELPIDSSKVFAAGFSNGGSLAYRLACEAGSTFKKAAAVGSALEQPECKAVTPASMLAIYGTSDFSFSPEAVRGNLQPKRSTAESVELLSTAFSCNRQQEVAMKYGPLQARGFRGCQDNVRIDTIELADIGHTWTPEMSQAMWAFFSADIP